MRRMVRRSVLSAATLLGGCAPLAQGLGRPDPAFAGPRLEDDALVSLDGARLPLQTWGAAGDGPWAVVLGLHGMNDYANAFNLAGPAWAGAGIATYAYDQRGFGRAPNRGVWGGEAAMTEDLRVACALLRRRHPRAVLGVVGESMGGAVAICASASDRPPDCDRLVLSSPAVWGWGAQPLPYAAALWMAAHVAPASVLEPPAWLRGRVRASDNEAELARMGRDCRLIWGARIDALYGLVELMQRARERIGAVSGPALYCYGAHDEIIPPNAALHAAAALPRRDRTAYYPDGWHLLMRDLHRRAVLDDVAAFLRDPAAPLPSGAPPIPPPRAGWRRA